MKKYAFVFLCACMFCHLFSESVATSFEAALVQGYEAYRNEDWQSAMIFFRKAVSSPATSTDESWYLLIMSEVYAGEYAAAHADCVRFTTQFAFSQYAPYIQYQNGRCLHFLGQHENAVLVLSDFCHQNPKHDLYASALYWIAEAFFAEYNYDAARGLYERIVVDYPTDAKTAAAQYRLESIDQRSREEKLLYLLKVTGEENLASREDYERQLRQYEAEDKLGLRQKLTAAEGRIQELERELASAKAGQASSGEGTASGVHDVPTVSQTATAETASKSTAFEDDPDVLALKRKARQLQYLLDEQKNAETTE